MPNNGVPDVIVFRSIKPMSLGIAFKGSEGIVLAADSRVTLMAQIQPPTPAAPTLLLPAFFDHAVKLLKIPSQSHVGAVTYGAGAIGVQEPRTAHSFMPEFDSELNGKHSSQRLTVEEYAKRLSAFFTKQWKNAKLPPNIQVEDMVFLVAGYDPDGVYGRVFEFLVPSNPTPRETVPLGQFGAVWGGQRQYVDRIINGFDPRVIEIAAKALNLDQGASQKLEQDLRLQLSARVPWQFLPLQNCIDLAIFLIRTTISVQQSTVDIRGVGGFVDVATITRKEGFQAVQIKQISGERV